MYLRGKDRNRRWHILQYLLERGAFDPLTAVPRRELLEVMGISKEWLSNEMRRLKAHGYIIGFPRKHNTHYFLGSKAKSFLKRWPDFLNHPFYEI
jgi:DNA-binding Lrp family transcriptional regulator